MTGTCVICFENPFDYVDEDGQAWDICKDCAFMEWMVKKYGRGVMEVEFWDLAILDLGGVDTSKWV